jgi:radical SAM superfamily enzyme YgiQ (UPF0313 family)
MSERNPNQEKIAAKLRRLFPGGCQRVLLVNVPQVAERDFNLAVARAKRNTCFPPYGLGLLSRNLGRAGYTVKILDLNFEILSRVAEAAFQYPMWKARLQEAIQAWNPDLIGISCMFSMTHSIMNEVAGQAKACSPRTPVILGGVHASGNAEAILRENAAIDFVMKYEADNAIVSLVDFVNGKTEAGSLSQIAMAQDGEYVELPGRDLPGETVLNLCPDYGDLPIGQYSAAGQIGAFFWLRDPRPKVGTVLATRGCRGRCTYCSVNSFNGKKVRSRTPQSVADEMQQAVEEQGISHFMWLDDDLFGKRSIETFNEITRRGLKITWDASNGVIASATTEEMIRAASESGCIGLAFGIESGDPGILRKVRKPSRVEHFYAAGEIMKRFPHIFTKGNLMIGFPGETIGQIQTTINLAQRIGFDWYTITSVAFLGGTEMAREMVETGQIKETDVVNARFFVSPNGRRRRKEVEETASSLFSTQILEPENWPLVPTEEDLADIWFIMDYQLNFAPVLNESNPVKVRLKHLMFQDILERVPEHALASLFCALTSRKLGLADQVGEHLERTERILSKSAFWRVRLEKFGLDATLADLRRSQAPLETACPA